MTSLHEAISDLSATLKEQDKRIKEIEETAVDLTVIQRIIDAFGRADPALSAVIEGALDGMISALDQAGSSEDGSALRDAIMRFRRFINDDE